LRRQQKAHRGIGEEAWLPAVNAGLGKRDWNISRHKMNPELVIRDSTRAAVLSGSDD